MLKLFSFCWVFAKRKKNEKEEWLDKKGEDYMETEWKIVRGVFVRYSPYISDRCNEVKRVCGYISIKRVVIPSEVLGNGDS
jgi:hypothetical protein